jgi:hypothetical protein
VFTGERVFHHRAWYHLLERIDSRCP